MATGAKSRALIEASLLRARADLGVPSTAAARTERHYQIANRLAHLWWLHVERASRRGSCSSGSRAPLTGGTALGQGWRAQVAGTFAAFGLPARHRLADRVGVAVLSA